MLLKQLENVATRPLGVTFKVLNDEKLRPQIPLCFLEETFEDLEFESFDIEFRSVHLGDLLGGQNFS